VHRRQLRTATPTAGSITPVAVWMRSASLSGGATTILCTGGNSGAAAANAGMHACNHLMQLALLSGSVSEFGVLKVPLERFIVCRICAGCGYPKRSRTLSGGWGSIGVWRQLQSVTPCAESRLSWRLNVCCGLSREDVRQVLCSGGNSPAATPIARVTPVVVRICAAPSLGGMLTRSGYWRQLRYSHFVCGNHACRGAWVRSAVAFGGRLSDSELRRQLPSSHANARIKDLRLSWRRMRSGLPRETRWIRCPESSSGAATL